MNESWMNIQTWSWRAASHETFPCLPQSSWTTQTGLGLMQTRSALCVLYQALSCTPTEGTLAPWRGLQSQQRRAQGRWPPVLGCLWPHFALFIQGQDMLLFPYKMQHFPHIWYFIVILIQNKCLKLNSHTLRGSTQKWNQVNVCFPPSWFYVKPDRHLEAQRQAFFPISILRQ